MHISLHLRSELRQNPVWCPMQCEWQSRAVWHPRGALPLWESVGMRRDFAPHFRHLDDLFAPQNLTLSTILFRSCWVPFRSPPFSACRRSFCPQNWPNLSFYSDLVGSHFELRAVHPYWFWPGVPTPRGGTRPCAVSKTAVWILCVQNGWCGEDIYNRFFYCIQVLS